MRASARASVVAMTAHGSPERVPVEALLAHRQWVRALARSLYLDRNDADDLEQETWRMALERPPRHAASLRAWFARAVRNAAVSKARQRNVRGARESEVLPRGGDPTPEEAVAEAELLARLAQAVVRLDEPYRTAVVLRYSKGMEASEIAARLSVPVETVRTRLKRAVEQLRRSMGVDLGNDRDARCLLLFGVRAGRHTPVTPGAVAASSGALAGGAVMAAGTKALAVTVVLALGVVWWSATDHSEITPAGRAADVGPVQAAVDNGAREPRRVHPEESGEASQETSAAPRIRGQVVDPEGNPAAGVRVVLRPEQLSGGKPLDLAGDGHAASGSSREVRTDAGGAFAAEPLDAPGVASAFALREDGALGVAPEIRPGEDVSIVLTAPASLVGRVTDPNGTALANARVRVGCIIDGGSLVREGRTNAEGDYRIAGIPVRSADAANGLAAAQVEFAADGFAPKLIPVFSEETTFRSREERRIDVRLLSGATLVGGVVAAESGNPVGGASIDLVSEEGSMWFDLPRGRSVGNPFAPRTLATTQSAADGTFRLEHLPIADARSSMSRLGFVRVSKDAYAVAEADVRVARDGATVDVRVTLRRTAIISGRVVDREGRPVAGLGVWARIGDEPNSVSAKTDADGRYRLERFPAPVADASAVVHAFRSYDDRDQFAAQTARAEVTVRAGADVVAPDLVWTLPDWPVVHYVVVDENGAPVRDAVIQSAGDSIAILRCDDAGRGERAQRPYPADYPKPWPTQRWVVRAPGHAPAAVSVAPDPQDGLELRVVMRPGRRIAGRVLSSDGKPRSGVLVRALDPAVDVATVFDLYQRTSFDSLAIRWPNVPFLGATRANDDGAFEMTDLPEGPFTVGAWSGAAGEWAVVTDVRGGAAGLVLRLPDADAALATLGVRVVVHAVDEHGVPVLAASPALAVGPAGAIWSAADPSHPGTSAFAPLPAGTWRLQIDAPGFVPWSRDGVVVEKGRAADPIEAVLRRGAAIGGRVTLPDGTTTGGRCVLLVSESGERVSFPLDADGSFHGSGLSPGRWRVTVAPNLWPADPHPSFAAVDGGTVGIADENSKVHVDARCVASGAIAVELGDRRLPTSGIACDDDKWRFGEDSTAELRDSSGNRVHFVRGLRRIHLFRHLVLPAGQYTLRIAYPSGDSVEQSFEVVVGKTTTVPVGAR